MIRISSLRAFTAAGCVAAALAAPASAVVTFYYGSGPNPNGDQAFKTAVCTPMIEYDFDLLPAGVFIDLFDLLPASNVIVNVGLGASQATPMNVVQIFQGNYPPNGQYGTINNKTISNVGNDGLTRQQIAFAFNPPVFAVGIWIYDDVAATADAFRVMVIEQPPLGGSLESNILDFNPGVNGTTVEGFIGARSTQGITRIHVTKGTWNGITPASWSPAPATGAGSFKVDHLHVLAPLQPGDLNADGVVGAADLGILLGSWGPCPACCPANLNGDGTVNAADLGILLGNWG